MLIKKNKNNNSLLNSFLSIFYNFFIIEIYNFEYVFLIFIINTNNKSKSKVILLINKI